MTFNWTCPHCDRAQTVVDESHKLIHNHIYLADLPEGSVGSTILAIRCANSDCGKLSVRAVVHLDKWNASKLEWFSDHENTLANEWLIPRGSAKPQPEYIPKAIRDDYEEACLIRDLSPKAAATLARRCIQGMIRDFCGIAKGTLDAEIRALNDAIDNNTAPRAVSVESVQAIDHLRKIGNIGAHMERDINIIVDVDPGEAQALIELVEMLLREWYVDRHSRQQRLSNVEAIRINKDQAKLISPTSDGSNSATGLD